MPKKNQVAFVRPADPKFLRLMKEQIGYSDGPTIEAKRQRLEEGFGSDSDSDPDLDEEQPQIVVLKTGDLTAEEAEIERKRIEKENDETPADLSEKIVFKSKKTSEKKTDDAQPSTKETKEAKETKESKKARKEKQKEQQQSKNKLSFGDEDEEDDD